MTYLATQCTHCTFWMLTRVWVDFTLNPKFTYVSLTTGSLTHTNLSTLKSPGSYTGPGIHAASNNGVTCTGKGTAGHTQIRISHSQIE